MVTDAPLAFAGQRRRLLHTLLVCYLFFFFFCCFAFSSTAASSQIQIDESVPVEEATVVLAEVARLPCSLEPPDADDQVALVIWFKDDNASPIYSVDARGRVPSHWADDRRLGGRSFFRLAGDRPPGPHLAIEGVRVADAGAYRCRVDFRRSPTRNSVVRLTVIVPPDNVSILDEDGRVVKEALGPYPEGAQPTISCVATGGRPIPRLYWRVDGTPPLDGSGGQAEQRLLPEGGVSASLRLPRLSRRHLLVVVSCQAVSSPHVPPVAASAAIHLLLEPLSVRLVGDNSPLSAGRQYELRCETAGSRPAAAVTWWKDGEQLPSVDSTSADGNVTTSVSQVTVSLEDAGRQLCCHAANPRVQGAALSDCWTLHVRYSPVVSLELGSNINGSAIREGVDVYFECNVRADPWIRKVIWRHNGRQLHNNVSAGTLLSNQTLVLQAVTRNSSGLYTCVASNSEGDSESNAFNLDVKFPPECRRGQQLVWGAARREALQVPCEVEARPPARLFRWAFNSSAAAADARPLDAGVTAAAPGRSVLLYQPAGERDYGTLLCWGRNELGAQAVPCVFHIVPAGRPDAPHSCEVSGRGATSVRVTCARGSDGGLPQQFTLELRDAAGLLVANVSARGRPDFLVEGLRPAAAYRASVYSSNGKGRSQASASLQAETRAAPQHHPEPPQRQPSHHADMEPTPMAPLADRGAPGDSPGGGVSRRTVLVLSLVGVGAGLLLAGLALAAAVIGVRRRRMRRAAAGRSGADGGSPRDKAPPSSLPSSDDNPDVVPQKEEAVLPVADLKALQQYGLLLQEARRPTTLVDSAAQTTVVYGAAATFPMTEAVVLAPCWAAGAAPLPGGGAGPPEAALPNVATPKTPRHDAGTQTPLPSRHKESAV